MRVRVAGYERKVFLEVTRNRRTVSVVFDGRCFGHFVERLGLVDVPETFNPVVCDRPSKFHRSCTGTWETFFTELFVIGRNGGMYFDAANQTRKNKKLIWLMFGDLIGENPLYFLPQ